MKIKSLLFYFFIFFLNYSVFSQEVFFPPIEGRRSLIEEIETTPDPPIDNSDKTESDSSKPNNSKNDNSKPDIPKKEKNLPIEKTAEMFLDGESNIFELHEKKENKPVTRTIIIKSARTTEYKKIKGKKKKKDEGDFQNVELKIDEKVQENVKDNEEHEKEAGDDTEEKNESVEEGQLEDSLKADSGKEEDEYEELVIFIGSVSISVSDGSSTSTIIADKVIYNKTRSTMEATGNVQFERKVGDQVAEKFVGEYLLFDIQKLQGVFYNGIIQQASNKKGRDPFSIHTYIAGKDESGVIGFKSSFLTTSKSEDSLWSIKATRLWILPGNEMAFANGVLSIGVVPLFYLPFFYYPADEMLFHPVFGFKNREGYFLQTTTYIIGRKPLAKQDKASSFSNFLQGDTLKKQKLEGLFFKKLDESDSIQDPSYLKVMFDIYSRLGYLIGAEGKFKPKRGYIRSIDFSAFFSFSHTIYPIKSKSLSSINTLFSSFAPGAIKKSELNKSNLFGKIVPFRYNFSFNTSVTKDPFNISIDFPFISDPYFKKDFMWRGEDMNWFNYLLNKDKLAKESTSTSEETSYAWKMQGSIRPYFPILRPLISSMSIDDISTIVNFYSKTNSNLKDQDALYSPERKFYYPQSAKPIFKASLSGTIFSTSMLEKRTIKVKTAKEMDVVLKDIKNPFLEVQEKTEEEENLDDEAKEEDASSKKPKKLSEMTDEELKQKEMEITAGIYDSLTDNFLPLYKGSSPQSYKSYFLTTILKYDLTYKVSGQAIYEAIFDHEMWKAPKDINWKKFYSKYYQLKTDASLNSNLSIYKGILTFTNSFIFTSNYQDHPYIKDVQKKNTLKLNNYKANVFNLKNTNTLKISPFVDFDMFKSTSFSWTLSETLVQRKFDGTMDAPKWKIERFKWKKEFVSAHSASAVLAWAFKGYTQSFNLSMSLKPLLRSYSMSASFAFPYVKATLSTKRFEKEKPDKEKPNQKWFWEPLKFTTSISFPYSISLSQEYIYNIEDKKHDKFSLKFSWKYLSASYIMSRTVPYKLDKNAGWKATGKEKKFIPTSFSLSASSAPIEFYFWKNRVNIKTSLSSNLNFNLIRLTDSYLTFSPKITFGIYEFVDVSFGVTSRNDSIVKYFNNLFNLPVDFAGETNIFKDIGYSLFFWDTEKRKQSDFKVKSIDFQLTHNLKDWTMTLSYSIKPTLKTEKGKKIYKFDPIISFFVQWNPIGDIKIRAKTEEKKFSVERGEIK